MNTLLIIVAYISVGLLVSTMFATYIKRHDRSMMDWWLPFIIISVPFWPLFFPLAVIYLIGRALFVIVDEVSERLA